LHGSDTYEIFALAMKLKFSYLIVAIGLVIRATIIPMCFPFSNNSWHQTLLFGYVIWLFGSSDSLFTWPTSSALVLLGLSLRPLLDWSVVL
jgi:hypothetical protein